MKKQILKLALVALFLCLFIAPTLPQASVSLYCWNPSGTGASQFVPCNSTTPLQVTNTPTGTQNVVVAPTSVAGNGIAPVVSGAAENNHVLKATAGNLYSVYATNLTGTAGFLVVLNATTSPSDGAITPLDCAPLPGNSTASINYRPGPPEVFSTGIVAIVTSANTCFTKTTGVITAFFHGDVQ